MITWKKFIMKQSKNLRSKQIAFVYNKLHPLHGKLLKSVNCDFIPLSNKIPSNYDVYVVEGTYIKPVLLKKLRVIKRDKKIITLFSDPRLFYLSTGKRFDFKNEKMVRYSLWRSTIAKIFIQEIDGAICIGDFIESLFRQFNKKSPVLNIPGFIYREKIKPISEISPNLNNKRILFIGHGPDYNVKGIDLLIEVFEDIKNKFHDAELYILGNWKVRKEWLKEGIHFEGSKDIIPYLKNSSLSIHLGRGESFGLNILESMLAGIPTMVSENTGAMQAIKKVDRGLILPLRKETIVKKIEDYFKLSIKRKGELSRKSRKVAGDFNEERVLAAFKNKFSKLIDDVYKK